MRRAPILPWTLLLLAAPAGAQAPALKLLEGWQAGAWEVREIGRRDTVSQCLRAPDALLLDGDAVAPGCRLTVIADEAGRAAVGYSCPAGRTGRTDLRRDTEGVFTVRAQGIRDGLPFARVREWRRAGDCPAR